MTQDDNSRSRQKWFNLLVTGVVSQVGCVTLVIILGAVFLGLYLDRSLGASRHWYTLVITLASIPVSLGVMIVIVRVAIKKIKPEKPETK